MDLCCLGHFLVWGFGICYYYDRYICGKDIWGYERIINWGDKVMRIFGIAVGEASTRFYFTYQFYKRVITN